MKTPTQNIAQHTPGPWECSALPMIGPFYVGKYDQKGNWHAIAEVRGLDGNGPLIAAAPDLLAALEECTTDDGANCLAYGSDTPALRRRIAAINSIARAAIARATGVQSCAH